jgi:hypothetical protein
MMKGILVSLAILTLSTSAALAAQRTYHRPAMNASARVAPAPAPAPAPVMWMGGVSSGDRDMYIRNLRDSGYDRKKNFNASGNVVTQ